MFQAELGAAEVYPNFQKKSVFALLKRGAEKGVPSVALLPHLQQGLQGQVQCERSRAHAHRREAVLVPTVWKMFPTEGASGEAPADARQQADRRRGGGGRPNG